MINEGKFGVQETVALTTITIGAKIFFTSSAWLTNFVATAGWQMTLISNLTSIIVFAFILALMKRFPGKNIIEIFELSLGRFIGLIFSLTFAAGFIQGAGVLEREFAEVLKIYVYPEVPIELILGSFAVTVSIVSFLGIETIARVAKLSAYAMLFLTVLLLALGIQNYSATNLFPILGYGLDKTAVTGLMRSSAYDEVLIITVFAGSLQGFKYLRKACYISLVFSGLILCLGLLFIQLAFPVQSLQEMVAPMYILARSVKYGTFFQRMDSLFLFLWIFVTLIAISALLYCSTSCYSKAFKMNDIRPAVFPMSLILFAIAFIPKDITSVIEGNVQSLRSYGLAVFYGLPLITLAVAVLRKKRGNA